MPSVQRRTADAWEAGSREERARAASALSTLLARKTAVDSAAAARDGRKETFRRGGPAAVALVHVPAMEADWAGPGTRIEPLRSPSDWKPSGKTADEGRMRLALARHVYGRYHTPAFLDRMWFHDERGGIAGRAPVTVRGTAPVRRTGYAFAALWKAVASGVSLHKSCFAPLGILSRKESHFFTCAPEWCTGPQAIWWARALAWTGSRAAADLVARSRIVDFSGDALAAPDPRWLAVARFVSAARDGDALRGDEFAEALDWIRDRMGADPEWGIEGRTAATVRRASREWHAFVVRQKAWSTENWTAYPVDDWQWEEALPGDQGRRIWSMKQITTGKALAAEGHEQRHCVASYISRCAKGDSAILSLAVSRKPFDPPKRAVTVELNRNWDVVQAKGYANRAPTSEESRALSRWAACNGIRY